MAVAGLVAAAALVVVAQQPTDAARNPADGSTTIIFTDTGGQTVTCTLIANAVHDTSDNTVTASGGTSGNGSSCTSQAFVTVTISAKDENGVLHHAQAAAEKAVSVFADHAVSAVNVTADVHFYLCDPNASTSCDTSVRVSPK